MCHESQSEVDGRARTARGDEFSVHDHTFIGKDRRELAGHGEVCGIAAGAQQPGIVEYGGRGTDGGGVGRWR